jgi:hypothetical protein
MTSELRVDNLKGSTTGGSINVLGEGTSATTNLQQGLVKAWMQLNGTGTIALADSFNISSVNDDATGIYTPTFTNNYANNDFSVSGSGGVSSTRPVIRFDEGTTSTQKQEMRSESDGNAYDEASTRQMSMGDLA